MPLGRVCARVASITAQDVVSRNLVMSEQRKRLQMRSQMHIAQGHPCLRASARSVSDSVCYGELELERGGTVIGTVRPTAKPAEKPKRGRRRPDPLADVTDRLRDWFEDEPWRTSRQLLERLHAEYPDRYPDKLLRTLQRRVKVWRRERVHDLVFGPYDPGTMNSQPASAAAADSQLRAADGAPE